MCEVASDLRRISPIVGRGGSAVLPEARSGEPGRQGGDGAAVALWRRQGQVVRRLGSSAVG
eukprot:5268198-Pleurochrysis_carterae.AAC.1